MIQDNENQKDTNKHPLDKLSVGAVISLVADMVIIRRRDAKRWKNVYLVKGVSLPPLAYNFRLTTIK